MTPAAHARAARRQVEEALGPYVRLWRWSRGAAA